MCDYGSVTVLMDNCIFLAILMNGKRQNLVSGLVLISIHRWQIELHVVYFLCLTLSLSQDVREADFKYNII